MFDTPFELLRQIQLGEDSRLELKEVRFGDRGVTGPNRESFADELAAFANTLGGVCVLGVEDRGRDVVGIPVDKLDLVEAFVRDACNGLIVPPVLPLIHRMRLPNLVGEELPVLKVEVERSLFVHRSPGGYFQRAGSSKREMQPDYLARLFQQRSQARIIRFDEQVVPASDLFELEPALWERFRGPYSAEDEKQELLIKLGMARVDGDDSVKPTVAGVLMGTRDPRRYIPNAYIQAVCYLGREIEPQAGKNYQLDAADISGPLDMQVMDGLRFVRRNQRTRAVKDIGRADQPQYDLTAVFEALVNAVAHRDYAIHGAKIRLRMFSNRIELYVPGALPNTMTLASLEFRQSARNEVLTSLLARCPIDGEEGGFVTLRKTLMDKRGEGVGLIQRLTEAIAGKRAIYELIDSEELRVTIPAAWEPEL